MHYSYLMLSIFRYPKFSGTTRGSLTNLCCYCETKNFPSEIVIKPTYAKSSSKPENSELLNVFSTNCFSNVIEDKFNGKSRHPLSFTSQKFRYKKLSQTQRGSSAKIFGPVRPNNFDRNSRHPAPLFSLTFFETTKFLKHRRFPLRKRLVLRDRTLLSETRDNRPLSHQRYFVIPEFFWNNEGSP